MAKKGSKKESASANVVDVESMGSDSASQLLYSNLKMSGVHMDLKSIPLASIVIPEHSKVARNTTCIGLTASVGSLGLLSPVSVLTLEAVDTYLLLDGFRRVYAAEKLQLTEVLCLVYSFDDAIVAKQYAGFFSILLSRQAKHSVKELWDLSLVLQEQVAGITSSVIEYMLQMNSGDYLRLQDCMSCKFGEKVIMPLLDGKFTIEQAYKKLMALRKEEEKSLLELEDSGEVGVGGVAVSDSAGEFDESSDGSASKSNGETKGTSGRSYGVLSDDAVRQLLGMAHGGGLFDESDVGESTDGESTDGEATDGASADGESTDGVSTSVSVASPESPSTIFNKDGAVVSFDSADISDLDRTDDIRSFLEANMDLHDLELKDGEPVRKKFQRKPLPKGLRKQTFERDHLTCRCCASGGEHYRGVLDWHHIIPVSAGGQNELKNGLTLCVRCHQLLHLYADGYLIISASMVETWAEVERLTFKRILHYGNIAIQAKKLVGVSRADAEVLDRAANQVGRNAYWNMAAENGLTKQAQ